MGQWRFIPVFVFAACCEAEERSDEASAVVAFGVTSSRRQIPSTPAEVSQIEIDSKNSCIGLVPLPAKYR